MRVLATLTLLALAGPATLSAQGDTTFTAWLRFRTPAGLDLREPEIFRSPWAGGPRLGAARAGDAWLRSVDAVRDSLEDNRVTAMRLRHIYGRKAPGMEDSLAAGPRGAFGLNRKYADLNIDGQARTELRTEKLKNLRCTPAQLLDLNSGCRGGFKTPRFDTYLSVRAGGLIGRRLHVDVDYDTERDFTARNNLQVYYQGLEDEVVRRVEVGSVTFTPPPSRFIAATIPANNFGVNATFQVGPLEIRSIAATQKGSVVAERTYTVGSTTVQPQDREARDLDFEAARFFFVPDPASLPGYPRVDILQPPARTSLPAGAQINQGDVRVYRYRPFTNTQTNPNLGGINAIAVSADGLQQQTGIWQLLNRDVDYYVDPSGLWIALAARLDQNDFLAVSYRSAAGQVGTFPAQDQGLPIRDTLRLIFQPRVGAEAVTFRHEIRNAYRVAGADLDLNSLVVNLSLNRSERPLRPGAQSTYLAELGLATADNPALFNRQDRLFPRGREPNAQLTIKESYIIFPSLAPFADPARLLATERNDSLYATPDYLLFDQGPPAKFVFRLRYNASSTGDRSTLDLGALQIRDGSETLYMNGRRLEKGIDYNINYDLGQVTFLNPQGLFGNTAATINARFEERGVFAVAPTQIYGLSTRYSLGETGGINLMGIYQVEQSAFNRPQLGFEASAHMVGGISTDLRFKPQAVTRFFNSLTSAPAIAPSRLDLNAELALTRPDPNRSGQAYLEEFEGDRGIALSLRESLWQFGSRPAFVDGVQDIFPFAFDTADAVQLTWQNLIQENQGTTLRARDIDNNIQVVGQQDQLETVLYTSLQPDTAGGQVQRDRTIKWRMPQRLNAPRWRSMVTAISTTGVDLSKNEFLEFWVFDRLHRADSAGVRMIVDLGSVNEDAIAIAPESLTVNGIDTTYAGRQFVGLGRLDTERQTTGVFNAETDDIGILADRPDALIVNSEPRQRLALCRRELGNGVPVYPWGDLGSRCTNGNGFLDTEDLDGDNVLNAGGEAENVFRWVVDLRNSPYFVRTGVTSPDGSAWKLYRIPLRTPEFPLGSPNIRLVKHLRITYVAENDGGQPDIQADIALARMRFLGSPWARRSDRPITGIAGATGASTGDVVASTVSTENQELGYESPPGVNGGLDSKSGGKNEFGTQVNERSLRIIGRGVADSQRVEAYFRFPSGPQNLLGYRELRAWFRGRGPGWGPTGDFQAYLRVGSDSRNFYQYATDASTTTWLPEVRVDLERWRNLRGAIESRRLQGLAPDSAARVACGGNPLDRDAYVLCDGPYLVHIQDVAVNPPNLASVQEIAAGIFRRATTEASDSAEVWVDDIRLVDPIAKVGTAMAVDARLVASDVGEFNAGYVRQDGYFQQIGGQPSYRTSGTFQMGTGLRLDRFLPTSLGISLPIQVAYARTDVDPQLLSGTDIESQDLAGLRKPVSWNLSYAFDLRRSQRGRSWLVRGFVDPFGLSGAFTRASNVSELSSATSSGRELSLSYLLQPGRGGFGINLSGIVDKLPGFLKSTEFGQGLRRPGVTLTPASVRLTSGLSRNQSDLISYQVPVSRPADSLLAPARTLQDLWRNSAGLSWQPLGMLVLSGDLTSTRDLRRYSDSTSLGRLATESRKSFLGMDVGVERDRQLNTSFALTPRVTAWLHPRFNSQSAFVLSRSLTSREPIRADGDTAGAYILPQTLNNTRSYELGTGIEVGRILAALFGDSSTAGRASRRIRPFDVSDRLTRNSTFDLAAFDPGLDYQLGLGGLQSFLTQGSDSAIGAAEVRSTTFGSGADLPQGLSFNLGYTRTRTSRFQLVAGSFLTSETKQTEWPRGTVRVTRSLRRGPVSLLSLGTLFRTAEGTTTTPSQDGTPIVSRTFSSNVTPDAQLTLRNGMVMTFSYNRLRQESFSAGNLTRTSQNDFTAGLNHAFNLPASVSRIRRTIRSQLSGVISRGTSCFLRRDASDCLTISDTRRTEARASFDSDLANILTGGLSFSYSLNEARHLDRKFSQIVI
ncbi:MAG TPA: cell surface protein SprA, partial [Gemmatimonadales bacterium]|nr:cell surface protein SprA [Gemmatimonadales bacterium]